MAIIGLTLSTFVVSSYVMAFLYSLFLMICLCVSWNLFSGYVKYVNLGVAAFFGLGSYIGAYLSYYYSLPYFLNIPIAGLVVGVFAFGIGFVTLRVRGPYFVIATFALAEATRTFFIYIDGLRGKMGVPVPPQASEITYLLVMSLMAIAVAVAYAVKNSKFGMGLFAISENEDSAEASGIPVTKYKIIAFMLSSILFGVAGAIQNGRFGWVDPNAAFSSVITFTIIAAAYIGYAIFGSARSIYSPIVGAIILTVLSELVIGGEQVYLFRSILGILIVLLVFVMLEKEHLTTRIKNHLKI